MTFLHDKGNKLAAKWGLLHKGGGENDTDTACPAAFVANRDLEVGRARWWGREKGAVGRGRCGGVGRADAPRRLFSACR